MKRSFWTSVQTQYRDAIQQNKNCIHPSNWKPCFKALLNNAEYNSDKFLSAEDKLNQLETYTLGKRGPLEDIYLLKKNFLTK